MNTHIHALSLLHPDSEERVPTVNYRSRFFDQIYAAWIGNPEPVWILGGLYTAYQILIGLRSEAAPITVWLVAIFTCVAVLARRHYWYIAVPLTLIAIGIAAYGGDAALALLAAYILTFSSVSLLDTHKALGVVTALGVGVVAATFYEDAVFGKSFLIPVITIFALTCLTAALVRMRANSVAAKQKEQALLVELRESASQARASEKATRMATTLHDSVGHSLTAITTLTEGLQADDTLDGDVREMVELINEYARSGLRQTRTLVTSIANGEQDAPTEHTLEEIKELVQGINQLGIRAELDISLGVPATGTQIWWAYRIIREAITNTLKHATQATTIKASITATANGQIEIAVTDDGQQLGVHERTPSTGYGLSRIRTDLASVGGHLNAEPNVHGGWILHALIPTEATHD